MTPTSSAETEAAIVKPLSAPAARLLAAADACFADQSPLRLEFLRIALPLAILGFLSSRMLHADDWLSSAGFRIPDLARKDWRQPLYLPPLPLWGAYAVAAALALSGLLLSAGWKTRGAAAVFALAMAYVTYADRLSAFTVDKLGTVLAIGLLATPCGARYGMDAFLRRGSDPGSDAATVSWGNMRFFQALVVALYCASGISKAKGDWLSHPYVLWTHMHDSYQTVLTWWVANHLPMAAWTPLQWLVLAFEIGAPLWFALRVSRVPALFLALGIHLFIGLCFGPVKWFALLMIALVCGCFAPLPWLAIALRPFGGRRSR